MFPSTIQPNNPEVDNWITGHVRNIQIYQKSKIMLLLKMYIAHWLSIESKVNTHRLYKSMICRSTSFVHSGLAIEFSSHNKFSRNFIETHSCFNQLKFNTFEGLLREILSSYNEFRKNLKRACRIQLFENLIHEREFSG